MLPRRESDASITPAHAEQHHIDELLSQDFRGFKTGYNLLTVFLLE
jgi:hypothetical protein